MDYTVNNILSLISHIHSQSQNYVQEELKTLGLKELATSHGNILFCLSENENLTPGELSLKINRDKSTTTSLVKKLEKEGFIQLMKDKTDSRRKLITLTEEGRKYKEATGNLSKKLLEKTWKNFSQEEKEQLIFLLNKMSDNLK